MYLDYFLRPVPWVPVSYTVLQSIGSYFMVLIGLKVVGRRVFSDKSPKDLIILLLISRACEIVHEDAGYWGTVFAVMTFLALGGLSERIGWLRRFLNEPPVILLRDNRIKHENMRRYLIHEADLDEAARRYGLPSHQDFSEMMLEPGGDITGIPFKTTPSSTHSPTSRRSGE